MIANKLENYLALLTIRKAGKRRNTIIAGGVFLISFISVFAFGMLDRLSDRSLYLLMFMVICFGFSYLTTWVKLEIIKGSIEMIDELTE